MNFDFFLFLKDTIINLGDTNMLNEKKSRKTYLARSETRTSLLGLFLFLVCVVGFIDQQGFVGKYILYPFIYLFGVLFIIPVGGIAVLGIYLFIKRQSLKTKRYISPVALGFLFIFNLIGVSQNTYGLDSIISVYNTNFNNTYNLTFSEIMSSTLGGGFVGSFSFSFLMVLLSEAGAKFVWIVGLLVSSIFFLHPIVFALGNIAINKNRRKIEAKVGNKEYEPAEFRNFYDDLGIKSPQNNIDDDVGKIKVEDARSTVRVESTNPTSGFFFNDIIQSEKKPAEVKKETTVSGFNVFKDDFMNPKTNITSKGKPEIQGFNVFQDTIIIHNESSKTISNATNIPNIETQSKQAPISKVEISTIFDNIASEKTAIDTTSSARVENPVSKVTSTVVDMSEIEHFRDEIFDSNPVKVSPEVTNTTPISQPVIDNKVESKEENVTASNIPNKDVKTETIEKKPSRGAYKLPPISLLKDSSIVDNTMNRNQAEIKSVQLNQKFESLGIRAKVINFIVAPAFTRFEIEVDNDVKVSQFNQLKNDLMMAVSAEKVNILAPIPGTPYVGIEIPNSKRSSVGFKEIFAAIPYEKKSLKLLSVIGKDINDRVVSIEIDKTPHLLIAGTTGSGKSVCMNTVIISLLMRATPDEVKIILVDPKRVEMNMYNDIPHLLCPVITDAARASVALKKVVDVMESRYDLFEKSGKKNITFYNNERIANGEPILPYIVVIVDELADLMLIASKDVEESIRRITQLARAAGIHLIVATQRPSVDVITGVIKANIPSRVAFAVTSSIDSRTILDEIGAEELLGRGDMLIHLSGALNTQRVQGAYVSDEEIESVVDFVKKQREPSFDPNFLDLDPPKPEFASFGSYGDGDESEDNIYYTILSDIRTLDHVSTSWLQRKYSLGYPRAAKIIDMLESEGYISAPNGVKPREVYQNKFKDNDL